ncbi:hypothetical protein [Bacillus rhizoplanae]|uniref:hypothetical protein n=1 Tax=Bacillus rhizoplanae TaxID=2880966 RepID=UPI003D1D8BAA
MKFISDLPPDSEIEKLMKELHIEWDDIYATDSNTLARNVYQACRQLLPQRLISIYRNAGKLRNFEKDIIDHLVRNTYMINCINNSSVIIDNLNWCKGIIGKLHSLDENRHESELPSYNQEYLQDIGQSINYKNNLIKVVGPCLALKQVEKPNKGRNKKSEMTTDIELPEVVSPFVFFILHKTVIHKKKKSVSLNQICDDFLLYKDLSLNAKENHSWLNSYLLEREYNFHLIDEIKKMIDESDFIDLEGALEVLSLLSLIPDIEGRVNYIKVLMNALDEIAINQDEDGNSYGYVSDFILTQETKEFFWFKEIPKIIINLGLVIFPIMEALHYHANKKLLPTALSKGKIFDKDYIFDNVSNTKQHVEITQNIRFVQEQVKIINDENNVFSTLLNISPKQEDNDMDFYAKLIEEIELSQIKETVDEFVYHYEDRLLSSRQ